MASSLQGLMLEHQGSDHFDPKTDSSMSESESESLKYNQDGRYRSYSGDVDNVPVNECQQCISQEEMRLQFSNMLDLVIEDELIGVMKNSPDPEAFVMQRIAEISSEFLAAIQN